MMIIIVGTKMQAATATAGGVVAVAGIQMEAITSREPNPLDPTSKPSNPYTPKP